MSLYLGNNLISGSRTPIEPSRNMGQIISSTLPLVDAGLHLLDGSLISGSGSYSAFVDYIAGLVADYPDLFDTEANWQSAVTQYGVCGKFVYTPQKYAFIYPGDNSTGWYCNSLEVGANFYTASGSRLSTIASISGNHITISDSSLFPLGFDRDTANDVELSVRLPKITGIVEGTTDVTALGDLIEAGLPNITGSFYAYSYGNGGSSQAFAGSISNPNQLAQGTSGGFNYDTFNFNASRSNSIYGNSTTVQPQAIKVLYYIVIATSTKTDIEVDIDEIATDLNGKADRDGSNMVSSVKNFDGGWVHSISYLISSTTSLAAQTSRSFDLSSYLPNDNYQYEVIVSVTGTTSTTSGQTFNTWFKSDIFTNTYSFVGTRVITRTSSSMNSGTTVAIPVGTGRSIAIYNGSTYAGSITELWLSGYRRIGTNQ